MIRCYDKAFIIDFLRKEDEIANLNIIGAIENIDGKLFDNPKDEVEIYVDDLKNPNCVVVKEYEYWHYVYTKTEECLDIIKEEFFDKLNDFGISAADEKVFNKLKEGRNLEWEEPCMLLYVDESDLQEYENKLEITGGTIEDAKLINDFYTFKDEYSYEFIKDNLQNRPSSVYRVNGEAVAWVLVHRDNSVGIMYTKEEYRRGNVAYELSMNLLKEIIRRNQIPYIHIGIENEASFRLATKCGFKRYKQIFWFGISDEK